MWRSTDGGATWALLGDLPEPVSPGVMEIDPGDPDRMYTVGGVRGSSLGFWVSSDGGETWTTPAGFAEHADNSVGGWTNDVYHVAADPSDFDHVLLTFHSGFEFSGEAGVLESHDGGESWTRHEAMPGWGAGHSIWFVGSSDAWLLGTQNAGYWRTSNAGDSWTQVSEIDMQHGGVDAFYASTGVLYIGALGGILRSEDDGVTFELVGPATSDGYYSVVGDGVTPAAPAIRAYRITRGIAAVSSRAGRHGMDRISRCGSVGRARARGGDRVQPVGTAIRVALHCSGHEHRRRHERGRRRDRLRYDQRHRGHFGPRPRRHVHGRLAVRNARLRRRSL
jgi:hypothetical protein